jgi:hypothetical protein
MLDAILMDLVMQFQDIIKLLRMMWVFGEYSADLLEPLLILTICGVKMLIYWRFSFVRFLNELSI